MEEKILPFKSIPENWVKEFSGRKCNTVRVVDKNDWRFKILRENILYPEIIAVEIINTVTQEKFKRTLKDITFWNDVVILSW